MSAAKSPLKFPLSIPHRPDGQGMFAQSVDGDLIVPLFTAGFDPTPLLEKLGAPSSTTMTAFDTPEQFGGMLNHVIRSPEVTRIIGFVVNPTGTDLTTQEVIEPTRLRAWLNQSVDRN